jgi:hypothetical protein
VPCSLTCQSKTGFATLCGFSEFTNASDPPKKYKILTASGSLRQRTYGIGDFTCAGGTLSDVTINYSGSGIYTPLPTSCPSPDCSSLVNANCGAAQNPSCSTQSNTATTSSAIGNGCVCQTSGRGYNVTGTWTNSLSSEDTEDDAANRAASAISSWSDCSGGSSAYLTDRTGTGSFTFGFRNIQIKANWTAVIGKTYNVQINFARRLLGTSDPYIDLGMPFESTITADRIDESTDWVDVPNEAGWETIASGCLVVLSP